VTRASHQAEELARPLRDLGAEAILLPVIGIAGPLDKAPLKQAAAHANEYDWIVFTSANAIAFFVAELTGPPCECRARVATVGAATRECAERYGFAVDLTPHKYVAESLVESFASEVLAGRRILIPSAAVTRDVVATELRQRGAQVDVVEAYRNVIPPDTVEQVRGVFREPLPDWVTFASSSAVNNLVGLVGAAVLQRVKIAVIGPVTSDTASSHSLAVAAEARVPTVEGLVNAIVESARP
jgi:uroporphyrinogen III methyltransferase/synthase